MGYFKNIKIWGHYNYDKISVLVEFDKFSPKSPENLQN